MVGQYNEYMMVDEVMRRWPAAIRVMLNHGLLCAGCPVAAFHSVDDAIREHGIDGTSFRSELRAVTAAAR